MIILERVLVIKSSTNETGARQRTYLGHVEPPSKPIRLAAFQSKVIRIHSADLPRVVTSPVCVFVVHVVRNADLRKDHGMLAHILQTLIP
jgi:hypothetical protein